MKNNDQHRAALRDDLTKAVTKVMAGNDLPNEQQLEVLAETFLNVMHLYGEFCGQEHPRFSIERLEKMIAALDPEYAEIQNLAMEMYLEIEGEEQAEAEREAQRRATTRPTRGDYSNGVALDENGHEDLRYSWHMVFPPASSLRLTLSDFLIWVNGKDDAYVKKWFADTTSTYYEKYTHLQEPLEASDAHGLITTKLNKQKDGIALTSMPEAVKNDLKKRLRDLGFKIVPVDSPLLALVTYGEGRAAKTKLPLVQQRIAAGETIVGMHYEEMQEAVRHLEQDPESDLPF